MLLKKILNFFLFGSTMFFAAGAPAVGGGAGAGTGGGEGGGVGSGEGSGPIATWGPPVVGDKGGSSDGEDEGDGRAAVGGDEGESGEDLELSDGELGEGEGAEEGEGRSEQTFKQFLESIKNGLTAQDPKVAKQAEKQLKRIYGENQQFREAGFESPEEARELTDRLETLGGIEGIEKETGEAATLWNMIGAGDPAILDTLQKDYSEGLTKLFGPYVDRMAQMAPAVYAHKFARVFMATIGKESAGKMSALVALNQMMKIEGVRESEEFQRVAEVINEIDALAKKEPEGLLGNEKLTKRERELQAEKQELVKQRLGGQAAPILKSGAAKAVQARLGDKKLGPKALKQVLVWTQTEFARLSAKDAESKSNREALLAAGEHDKWLRNVKSITKRLMPLAAKAALRKYRGISGDTSSENERRRAEGSSRREAGGGGTSAGTIRTNKALVDQLVKDKMIDWDRMKIEAKKNGKDVEDMFSFDRAYFKKGDPRHLYRY
jgi:hypothetical protein